MFLFVQSQDIGSIAYGLTDDKHLLKLVTSEGAPEQDLLALDTFLSEQHVTLQDLEGIILVTGPGSFTASRISVTISNTLAFALRIPIFAIENTQHLKPEALLESFFSQPFPQAQTFAIPVYDRPPTITTSHSS